MNTNTRYWSLTWETNIKEKKLPTEQKLAAALNSIATDAIFQREKGSQKQKEHYQGVFTLNGKRDSKIGVLRLFQDYFNKPCHGLTLTPVYDAVAIRDYVTKEEGRVSGPYYVGRNEVYDTKFAEKKLRGWQGTFFELITGEMKSFFKDRKVILVSDVNGNSGKSWFIKWLRVGQKRIEVRKLPFTNVDRLISAVNIIHKKVEVDAYVVDLTRTTGKDQHFEDLFAALEDIKCGYVVDAMYGKANEAIFDPPMIIIFTNYDTEALTKYLSQDRWILFQIPPEKTLAEKYWDYHKNSYQYQPVRGDITLTFQEEFESFERTNLGDVENVDTSTKKENN